ncbi:MAG: type 4a pilus biogenesis protein PilO [Burkholderiales bacterium]|nr:type 4a pilus biogenesis protein PilO [Burkholderiales bacterium]
MKSVARYGRFFAGRIGIAGVCGLALLVFAAALLALSVQALDEDVRMLSTRAERLQASASANAPRAAQSNDPAVEVDALLGALPALETAPELVAQLHAHARSHGLVLEAGEYHVVSDADARLVRYQVRLPLKGSYVQIREFVAAVMSKIPNMMLDELSLRRGAISAAEAEARLQFVLLFSERR